MHLFEQAANLQPEHQQVVQELHHKAWLEDGGAELRADVVGCRLTKTYRSEVRRLLIATASGATGRMSREALVLWFIVRLRSPDSGPPIKYPQNTPKVQNRLPTPMPRKYVQE